MNSETIDSVLRPLSSALEADGYDVAIAVEHGGVSVRVTAGPDACEECLVPKPMMTEMLVQALTTAGVGLGREQLTLTYPNE